MQSIDSSNIEGVDYQNGKLTVKFKGGKHLYDYNLTPEEYQAFMSAKSKGSHFAKHIRSKPFVKRPI